MDVLHWELMSSSTSLSNPRNINMMKKKIAQSWGIGIKVTARGYAMNANPGPARPHRKCQIPRQGCTKHQWPSIPDSATIDMSTFCSFAMKPSTEKMAKPATKLVKLFNKHRYTQSLGEGAFVSTWAPVRKNLNVSRVRDKNQPVAVVAVLVVAP